MQITIKELEAKGITGIINLRVFRDLMYGNISGYSGDSKKVRNGAESIILKAKGASVAQVKLEGLDNYYSKDPTKIVGLNEEFEESLYSHSKSFIETLCRLNAVSNKTLIHGTIDKNDRELAVEMALDFAELRLERFIKKEA